MSHRRQAVRGCRSSAGICDPAESCDGAGDDCPTDLLTVAGTECRAASDVCDLAEECTGRAVACPTDALLPDGTVCDDSDDCTVDDQCELGVCTADAEYAIHRRASFGPEAILGDDLNVYATSGMTVFAIGSGAEEGTLITSARVRMGMGAAIHDVATTAVAGKGTVNGTQSLFPSLPDFDTRFPEPVVACGGESLTLAVDEQRDIRPGSYGDVYMLDRAQLHLAAGNYSFCNIEMYNEGQILVTSGTDATSIDVSDEFRTGFGVRLAATGDGTPAPTLRVAGALFLKNDNEIDAHIYAPTAAIRAGRGTDLRGSVIANVLAAKVAGRVGCSLHGEPTP